MKAGKPLACDKGKLFKKRSVDRLVSFFWELSTEE